MAGAPRLRRRRCARRGAIPRRVDGGRRRRVRARVPGGRTRSFPSPLHVGHHGAAEGRAAHPPQSPCGGAGPCPAVRVRVGGAHARRHAALPHHGHSFAGERGRGERLLRVPAGLEPRRRAGADRVGAAHRALRDPDALSRSGPLARVSPRAGRLGEEARVCRGAHAGRAHRALREGVPAGRVREPLREPWPPSGSTASRR